MSLSLFFTHTQIDYFFFIFNAIAWTKANFNGAPLRDIAKTKRCNKAWYGEQMVKRFTIETEFVVLTKQHLFIHLYWCKLYTQTTHRRVRGSMEKHAAAESFILSAAAFRDVTLKVRHIRSYSIRNKCFIDYHIWS